MRRRHLTGLLLALLILSAACTSLNYAISENRVRLNKLEPGMSKAQVLSVMGTENYKFLTNPYRTEMFQAADGAPVEVLYYVTADRGNDRTFLGDELTPIVIEKGSLVGWGWIYMKENAQRFRGDVGAR